MRYSARAQKPHTAARQGRESAGQRHQGRRETRGGGQAHACEECMVRVRTMRKKYADRPAQGGCRSSGAMPSNEVDDLNCRAPPFGAKRPAKQQNMGVPVSARAQPASESRLSEHGPILRTDFPQPPDVQRAHVRHAIARSMCARSWRHASAARKHSALRIEREGLCGQGTLTSSETACRRRNCNEKARAFRAWTTRAGGRQSAPCGLLERGDQDR